MKISKSASEGEMLVMKFHANIDVKEKKLLLLAKKIEIDKSFKNCFH